ncbi:MAG: non-heme iron oxygenase ferredoxin subunit [Lentisphaerota bacterium]
MKQWVDVAGVDEFEGTDRKAVDLGDEKQLGLFKTRDGLFAISAWCSHEKASLLLGEITGGEIMCPLHGARFDLKTGRNLSLPAVRPIKVYEVKLEGGRVLVWI